LNPDEEKEVISTAGAPQSEQEKEVISTTAVPQFDQEIPKAVMTKPAESRSDEEKKVILTSLPTSMEAVLPSKKHAPMRKISLYQRLH